MQSFELSRVTSVADALRSFATETPSSETARFIAGGTTLLDLMKLDVERPQKLVDITGLPLDRVERTSDGGLKIGALVRNADLAHHPDVVSRLPGSLRSAAVRCLGSTEEYGNHRRQPTAADALRLFSRYLYAPATSASPGPAAPLSKDTIARSRSWAPANTASPPILRI